MRNYEDFQVWQKAQGLGRGAFVSLALGAGFRFS
jgi:hypothetical protein